MYLKPPRPKPTDTLFPDPTLVRSNTPTSRKWSHPGLQAPRASAWAPSGRLLTLPASSPATTPATSPESASQSTAVADRGASHDEHPATRRPVHLRNFLPPRGLHATYSRDPASWAPHGTERRTGVSGQSV